MKWKSSDLRKNWGLFRMVNDDLLHEIRLFHIFPICDGYMSSSLSAIFVTRSNDVYALGRNRCGMLGLYSKDALPEPIAINELKGVNIKAIDTGLMHTLALTEDGLVWSWGLDIMKPYSHPLPTVGPCWDKWLGHYKVLQIACGSYFNLALTETYTVMYWGYYDITQNPLSRLISFFNEESIVSLSSGLLFSSAVGSSGKVYTWTGPRRDEWICSPGMATYDVKTKRSDVPLGRKMTKKDRPLEPRLVAFPEKATGAALKVVCAMRSLYILMDTGVTYVTGYIPSAFRLEKANKEQFAPDERSFCDSLLTITCPGYPTDISGSKWTDALVVECINPENFFVFSDSQKGTVRVKNIAQGYVDSPTPQMRSAYLVDQDFDEPVYVSPRLDLNKELFCSEALSDITFKLADQQEIPAHKYVLLAHSQYFKNMYSGDWKETKTNIIDVSKYNPKAYKAFLNFLYTGTLDKLDTVDLLELYHLADEYLEAGLKRLCLHEITKSNIDSNTVADLYDWALCNDLTSFAAKCVQYGSTHLQDVLKSDGFANMAGERREIFVKELFGANRSSGSRKASVSSKDSSTSSLSSIAL